MKINKAILFSYGKYLVTSFGTAILINLGKSHKITLNDLKWDSVSIALAVIPVVRNYFNKKYPAYGKVINEVAADVTASLPTPPAA
jgi:hypothetical protein